MTVEERFMGKVSPEPISGCWLWMGNVNANGYGMFWNGGKNVQAHRFAFGLLRGSIPNGMCLDHLCRVRRCVNPKHLEITDNKTNILRGFGQCAQNARKTHCKNGHEFTPDNVYYKNLGGRACRKCWTLYNRRNAPLRRAKRLALAGAPPQAEREGK